jgi:hypothetical protein
LQDITLTTTISQTPLHRYYNTEDAIYKIQVLYPVIQKDWLNAAKRLVAESYALFLSLI